jgi:hypothetical protein
MGILPICTQITLVGQNNVTMEKYYLVRWTKYLLDVIKNTKQESITSDNHLTRVLYIWRQSTTPQIEGKFTVTPGRLPNIFYGCKD